MIELRPHHLLCTQGYSGKGYNEAFVEHMNEVVHELRNVEGTKVKLTCYTDELCSCCPEKVAENVCRTQEKVAGFDKRTMEVFGLEEKEYVYSEIVDYIRQQATEEKLAYICEGCSWFPISACRKIINSAYH